VCYDKANRIIVTHSYDTFLEVVDEDAFLVLVSYSLINFMKSSSFVMLRHSLCSSS